MIKPVKPVDAKLGELLELRGHVDREVLFKALRTQRATGGRLGTCLLEIEAVSEEDLLHVLSDQLKMPFAGADELRTIEPEVLAIVPRKMAEQRRVVPFRASNTQISVAMIDPEDLAALDEISFVSGRRVRPHVTHEARLFEALAKHYRVDIPSRYVQLLDRLNRARFWSREAAEEAPTPSHASATPAAPPAPELRAPVGAPTPRIEAPAVSPLPRPASGAMQPELPAEAFEGKILAASDREEIGRTLIGYAAQRGATALLLKLQKGEASGWQATVPPLDAGAAAAIRIPLSAPSVVRALYDGAPLFRGTLPQLDAHRELRTLLASDSAQDLLAFPLRVRDRLAAVWILSRPRDRFPPAQIEEVLRLAAKASMALEMLILRHKLQQT